MSIPGLDAYFQYATVSEFVRVTELEPFDEWEEFHLKCCHYSLVIASQGNLKSWSRLCKFTSYFNIVNEGNEILYYCSQVHKFVRFCGFYYEE